MGYRLNFQKYSNCGEVETKCSSKGKGKERVCSNRLNNVMVTISMSMKLKVIGFREEVLSTTTHLYREEGPVILVKGVK